MPKSIIIKFIVIIKAVIVVTTCMSVFSCHFRNGKLDVVEYLITKTNCDVNTKEKDGNTPLDLARR